VVVCGFGATWANTKSCTIFGRIILIIIQRPRENENSQRNSEVFIKIMIIQTNYRLKKNTSFDSVIIK